MRLSSVVAAFASVLVTFNCQASQQWTGCAVVTGVSNYIPSDGAVIISLSPAVAGCTSSVSGAVGTITFKSGTLGVTADNINSLLASMLTAYTSGRSVMVFYDNVTGCPGELIANGGYSGQCP